MATYTATEIISGSTTLYWPRVGVTTISVTAASASCTIGGAGSGSISVTPGTPVAVSLTGGGTVSISYTATYGTQVVNMPGGTGADIDDFWNPPSDWDSASFLSVMTGDGGAGRTGTVSLGEGGGGGGGCDTANSAQCTTAGFPISINTPVSVSIGARKAAGLNGTGCFFTGDQGATFGATGGTSATGGGTGGAGVSARGKTGGNGAARSASVNGGGGGGSASSTTNGSNGVTTTGGAGQGAGGNGGATGTNGGAGTAPGGGGGGAGLGVGSIGGAGAAAQIVNTWTTTAPVITYTVSPSSASGTVGQQGPTFTSTASAAWNTSGQGNTITVTSSNALDTVVLVSGATILGGQHQATTFQPTNSSTAVLWAVIAGSAGARTISFSNNYGGADPASVTYTGVAATGTAVMGSQGFGLTPKKSLVTSSSFGIMSIDTNTT